VCDSGAAAANRACLAAPADAQATHLADNMAAILGRHKIKISLPQAASQQPGRQGRAGVGLCMLQEAERAGRERMAH
jgi:hypothetical protein